MELTEQELQAKIDAAVEGIKNKNTELLDKLTKANSTLKKLDGLDLEKLLNDSKTLEDLQKKSDEEKGEYKKLYEQFKSTAETELAKTKTALQEKDQVIATMIKKDAVSKALSAVKVDPLVMDLALSTILPNAAIDDSGNVMVNGKAPTEFAKEWAGSEVGKRLIISGNTGGGSTGGEGGNPDSVAKFFDPKSDSYNLTEQAKIAKTNIDLYNRLKGKYKK